MKNFTLKSLTLIVIIFSIFSCSTDHDGVYFKEKSIVILKNSVTYTGIESDLLNLINEHRDSLGLIPVSPLDIISSESSNHTDYMIT